MYSSKIILLVAALFSVSALAAPVVVPGVDFGERDVISPLPGMHLILPHMSTYFDLKQFSSVKRVVLAPIKV
jgi:hypothetical protein